MASPPRRPRRAPSSQGVLLLLALNALLAAAQLFQDPGQSKHSVMERRAAWRPPGVPSSHEGSQDRQPSARPAMGTRGTLPNSSYGGSSSRSIGGSSAEPTWSAMPSTQSTRMGVHAAPAAKRHHSLPTIPALSSMWVSGGRELAALHYDATSDPELNRRLHEARKLAGRSAKNVQLSRGLDGTILYADQSGGLRPLFSEREAAVRGVLHSLDARASASKLASPTLSVMGLDSDEDGNGDDDSESWEEGTTTPQSPEPRDPEVQPYSISISGRDVSAPDALDFLQRYLESLSKRVAAPATGSATSSANGAEAYTVSYNMATTVSALGTIGILQDLAAKGGALAVVSMTTAVTSKDSRGTQQATLSRAYTAYEMHLKRQCKNVEEMDTLLALLKRGERLSSPYAHGFEAFQRLPTLRDVLVTELKYEHDDYVFSSQCVSRDLKGLLQDMLEIWGMNPSRGPLFTSTSGCQTGFQLTDSTLAHRLRRRAAKRLGFKPDEETLFIVEVANDETADGGTSQDICRVRLRNMSALDNTVPYSLWMLLPVRGTVKCVDKEGRAVSKAANVDWNDAINALHREAMCHGLRCFAEVAKAPVSCVVGGKTIKARFVLGPVVGDMPVRASFLGSSQRWSTTSKSSTTASFISHYAHVYPKGDEGAGRGVTQLRDALISTQLESLEARSQKRDKALLQHTKAARRMGINPSAYDDAPLALPNIRLLDRHHHVFADPLHAFDGFVDVLDRIVAEAIGTSEWRNALALVQHPFADGSKRGLASNISDRVRETWKLVPAAFHCARKNLEDVQRLHAVRLLGYSCLLMGAYADVATSLLSVKISNFYDGICKSLNALQRLNVIRPNSVLTPKLVETLVSMKAMAAIERMRPASTSTAQFEKANKDAKNMNRLHGSGRLDTQKSIMQRTAATEIVNAFDSLQRFSGSTVDSSEEEGSDGADRHAPVKLKAFFRLLGKHTEVADSTACATAAWEAACVVLAELFGRAVKADAKEMAIKDMEQDIRWRSGQGPLRVANGLLLQAGWGEERVCLRDEVRVPRIYAQGTHHAVAYADAQKVAAAAESVPDGGPCTDSSCPFHQKIEFTASMVYEESTSYGIPVAFMQTCAAPHRTLVVVAKLTPHRPSQWTRHLGPAAGDVMVWWPASLANASQSRDGAARAWEADKELRELRTTKFERTPTERALPSDSSSDSTWTLDIDQGNIKPASLPAAIPDLIVIDASQVRGSRPITCVPGMGVWVSYVSARLLVAGMGV